MRIYLYVFLLLFATELKSQTNVGIGTTTPSAALHIRTAEWIKTIYEHEGAQTRAYLGVDDNATVTVATNAFWTGNQWSYPVNNSAAMMMMLHQLNERIEFRVRPGGGAQQTAMVIHTNGRVGIGTTSPQQMLSVGGAMNIDQSNTGNGNYPTLRLGGQSGEGIGSKRNSGFGQFGLDFFTGHQLRMRIFGDGKIGVGTGDIAPQAMLAIGNDITVNQNETINNISLQFGNFSGVGLGSRKIGGANPNGLDFYTSGFISMSISQNGNFYLGFPGTNEKLNVSGNISASRISGTDWFVDRLNTNTGVWGANEPAIRLGGASTGEGISSKRTAGDRQYGLDFYTGSQRRMSILSSGNVAVVNSLTVQNGKGIIRSADALQRKKVVSTVTISGAFNARQTRTFACTFPESFSSTPEVWVGNMVSGAGGWAEVLLTITDITTTGCTVWAHNVLPIAQSPSYTMKIIAIGPQ